MSPLEVNGNGKSKFAQEYKIIFDTINARIEEMQKNMGQDEDQSRQQDRILQKSTSNII